MANPVLDVRNLTISYGSTDAVRDLSFTVEPGQVVGLIGGNGAGKSSTLRAIAGVNPATSGNITIAGHSLSKPDSAHKAHLLTGYCPDVGGLIPKATPAEHINLSLAFREATDLRVHAMDMVERFGLGYAMNRPTSAFSHGEARRLSVVLAVIASRQLLILDEPFDGVDPLGVDATLQTVAEAAKAGVAVVVSTHLLSLLTECVDDVLVMAAGNAVDSGPVETYRGEAGATRYTNLLRGALR